jgi:hypothetical protein
MPPLHAFVENGLQGLRTLLKKSWTILPRQDPFKGYNSWWPIVVIVVVMVIFTILATYYDPFSPLNTTQVKPLIGLDQQAPTNPHFAEGAAVQVQLAGTVYADPSAHTMLQEALPEGNTGVVVDGVWRQGRWLYQVRFSPTVVGWVGEMDLIPASR